MAKKKDTYIPRDEVVDINKEFNQVRQQAEAELMKIPGVIAVGVGLKETQGEIQRVPCFKVTVEKKKSRSELKSNEVIPETIFGFPTDVVEIESGGATIDDKQYRPLLGGCKIEVSSNSSYYGTLGCLAKRNSDDKIVLLSNWHVIVGRADSVGDDRIGQPSHNGCCACCACNEIAKTVDGRFLNNNNDNMDAAIALLLGQDADTVPEHRYINEILQIGHIAGSAAPIALETVMKYGARTGFTKGQITNDNSGTSTEADIYNPKVTVNRTGQLLISPLAGYPKYSDSGDSGSVSVNEKNQVVALNYGGSFTTNSTFATSIIPILSTLGISIFNSTFHASEAGKEGVLLSSGAIAPPITNLADMLGELETELGQYPQARHLLDLFKIHRAEMLDLVNHRREVMAAWNRYQGPAWLAHIARSIRRDNKPLPEQIKGISLQNLLLKMTAVLQRNGSPALVQAVSDHYLDIIQIVSSGRRPEDWKAYLARMEKQATV